MPPEIIKIVDELDKQVAELKELINQPYQVIKSNKEND